MANPPERALGPGHPRLWLAGLAIALIALASAGIYAYSTGASLEDLSTLGYPGIFLMMLLSGSAIIIPLPGPAAVIAAGAIWNPVLVGISAGLGNSTAELVSYTTGRVAADAIHSYRANRFVSLLAGWLDRYGFWLILVIAAIPNPVFHVLSMLAGSVGYSPRRFWLATAIGNSGKYIAMAFLGQSALSLLSNFGGIHLP